MMPVMNFKAVGFVWSQAFLQRFIPHAQPARVLVDSFERIASYLHKLAAKEGEQGAWARAMHVDVQEMKSWLLLSIVADFL